MSATKHLQSLDSEENKAMLEKLPKYLVNRWSREVDNYMSRDDREYPPFKKFCDFMETEARIACNTVNLVNEKKIESTTSTKGRDRGSMAKASLLEARRSLCTPLLQQQPAKHVNSPTALSPVRTSRR